MQEILKYQAIVYDFHKVHQIASLLKSENFEQLDDEVLYSKASEIAENQINTDTIKWELHLTVLP